LADDPGGDESAGGDVLPASGAIPEAGAMPDPDGGGVASPPPDAPAGMAPPGRAGAFEVHLDVFEGPFDLLLGLISKHKLDVTEISLARVTDEFIAWIRERGSTWRLDEASEFLVVAATLLDLKAARLLPSAEVEDDEDLALLEARDLLFARLLQYRAFKEVAGSFATAMAVESRRFGRAAPIEPRFARLLPELVLGLTPEQLARIAAQASRPKPPPVVGLEHLHLPMVSVREQAALIVERLRRVRSVSFRTLVADAEETVVVVARFLALLELFREAAVAFEQATPLGELTIQWTGTDSGEISVGGDFDGSEAASSETASSESPPPQTPPTGGTSSPGPGPGDDEPVIAAGSPAVDR
jgi:segregation and condensation protein A